MRSCLRPQMKQRVAYYWRQADQGNAGEPSHSNEVVVEDWYYDNELLAQYVSD